MGSLTQRVCCCCCHGPEWQTCCMLHAGATTHCRGREHEKMRGTNSLMILFDDRSFVIATNVASRSPPQWPPWTYKYRTITRFSFTCIHPTASSFRSRCVHRVWILREGFYPPVPAWPFSICSTNLPVEETVQQTAHGRCHILRTETKAVRYEECIGLLCRCTKWEPQGDRRRPSKRVVQASSPFD